MHTILDLKRYPLDRPESPDFEELVATCRAQLDENGLFNLPGFINASTVTETVSALTPRFAAGAFTHSRRHNIYFKPQIDGLPADHPALVKLTTINQTLCADQLADTDLSALYHWPPFAHFLATVMGQPELYPMVDPLAAMNAMAYHEGNALNWHFDRSEFTTTLLLQAPDAGGAFEYAKELRSDTDPNYDGVADLLTGRLAATRMPLTAGTLNVFKGRNTAHRVTPVKGKTARMIAVFSYFDRPGVMFSDQERLGFYGRTE